MGVRGVRRDRRPRRHCAALGPDGQRGGASTGGYRDGRLPHPGRPQGRLPPDRALLPPIGDIPTAAALSLLRARNALRGAEAGIGALIAACDLADRAVESAEREHSTLAPSLRSIRCAPDIIRAGWEAARALVADQRSQAYLAAFDLAHAADGLLSDDDLNELRRNRCTIPAALPLPPE
jgi:hypothetical protein